MCNTLHMQSVQKHPEKGSTWRLKLNGVVVAGQPHSSLWNFIQAKHKLPNEIILKQVFVFNNDLDIAKMDAFLREGKHLGTLRVSVLLKVMDGAPVISKLNLHIWVTAPSHVLCMEVFGLVTCTYILPLQNVKCPCALLTCYQESPKVR